MKAFDDDIRQLRKYIEAKSSSDRKVRLIGSGNGNKSLVSSYFLSEGTSTIVFKEDTWLELGDPKTTSLAPVLVTERKDLVTDGAITLIGPDISEVSGSIPFAQILIIYSTEIKDEDYRKINSFQYELELKGYMIKAVPSSLSIWSRVSNDSVKAGLSFEILGRALIDSYRSKFNLQSAEVIFVTSSEEDVKELEEISSKVKRILKAMSKMIEEMSFDCSSCEYIDVCDDVRELRDLRERLMKSKT